MAYDKQESSLLGYNLFPPTSNLFCLNLAQISKNWLNSIVLRTAAAPKSFWSQNSNEIWNFSKKTITL